MTDWTVTTLAHAIAARKISPVEATRDCLSRIERLDQRIHAFSAHDYLQALRLRARFAREFIREVFGEVDALVLPVIPEPAPALETVKRGAVDEVVARMGRFSRLTRPFNGLGLPALALPCGFSADGRPLALQIVGRPFDEATVLRVGHAYQQATAWHLERPRLETEAR